MVRALLPKCARNSAGEDHGLSRHLRFAQSRALGRKVSDEFAVFCAEVIIARSTALVMKSRGGASLVLIRALRLGRFDWRQHPLVVSRRGNELVAPDG